MMTAKQQAEHQARMDKVNAYIKSLQPSNVVTSIPHSDTISTIKIT